MNQFDHPFTPRDGNFSGPGLLGGGMMQAQPYFGPQGSGGYGHGGMTMPNLGGLAERFQGGFSPAGNFRRGGVTGTNSMQPQGFATPPSQGFDPAQPPMQQPSFGIPNSPIHPQQGGQAQPYWGGVPTRSPYGPPIY